MTTCRTIITRALQLARVVGISRDPRASESDLGMEVLQGMYDGMFAGSMFGRLEDYYATENYTAEENQRIIADNATITIPDVINDDGTDRTPRDLSAIAIVTDTDEINYVFSGGRWELASNLTLDSTAPLATRDAIGLASLLAIDLAAAFGKEPPPAVRRRGIAFRGSVSYKLGSTRTDPVGVYY